MNTENEDEEESSSSSSRRSHGCACGAWECVCEYCVSCRWWGWDGGKKQGIN